VKPSILVVDARFPGVLAVAVRDRHGRQTDQYATSATPPRGQTVAEEFRRRPSQRCRTNGNREYEQQLLLTELSTQTAENRTTARPAHGDRRPTLAQREQTVRRVGRERVKNARAN